MTDIRFDIVETCCSGGAVLKDLSGEFPDLHLGFSIIDMDDDEKDELIKWLDWLNKPYLNLAKEEK